jgi:two-component system LytT family response regulator
MEVLVAEDESLARESLVYLLRDRSDVTEIHSVADGHEAIAALKNRDFDVLMLDVQMPGYSGIEVATHAKPNQHIIFTTAYDHYAVKAFELNAIDYVLKPFADSRLHEALDKVGQKYNASQTDYQELAQLVHQSWDLNKANNKRLILRESKKVKLFDHEDIAYIKGAGNYIEVVFTDGKKQLFRETLGKVEEQLHDTAFIRIHKSTIVRSDLISELNSSGKGDYKVILKSGSELVLSRRHRDKLSPLFNE